MKRRSFLASLGVMAAFVGIRPTLAFALPVNAIPSPENVYDLKSLNRWIGSWGCGQYTSRCAIQETRSRRTVEHIELAWGAAFSVDDLDVSALTYEDYGFLTDESKWRIRWCSAYPEALFKLYGYVARSIYGHAMAAGGADVYWRIKPEDDICLKYEMTDISPDGPDVDFVTGVRGKKVLSHGLIKFYCRLSFDTDRYVVVDDPYGWRQIDLNQKPVQWWDAAKPEGAPIQIIMRP